MRKVTLLVGFLMLFSALAAVFLAGGSGLALGAASGHGDGDGCQPFEHQYGGCEGPPGSAGGGGKPGVSIASGPSGPTASRSASFSFVIDVSPHKIADVVCSLDGAAVGCQAANASGKGKPTTTGSATFSDLAEGSHTFSVAVAVDHGKAPAPASRSWLVDVTPPVLHDVPADMQVAAAPGGSSATVSYTAPTATDNLDPSPTVSCSPASGTSFPVGTTTVKCTATDAAGNSSSATFSVLVNAAGTIAPGGSGTVTGSGPLQGISLVVPAGAFPQGATISLVPVANPDTSAPAGSEGDAFEIVSTAEPSAPVQLRVPYDEATNGPADGVTLGWWGDAAGEWLPVDTSHDSSTGELVASIRHFSLWNWFLHKVAGSTGTPPSCDGPLPSWVPKVYATATDSLSLAYSCAGGTSNQLQVRVTSNRFGWVYASFGQKPTAIRYIDGPVTFSGSSLPQGGIFGSSGDWRVYIPPHVVVEADFSEPAATSTAPVATTLQGYAARDGVTYVGDALTYALSQLWSSAASGVLAPAFVHCAADFINPTTLSLLPTIDYNTVFQCFVDQIEAAISDGGFDQVSASTLASDLGVMKKASLWLQIANISLDLLDAHLDSHTKPTVITAVENTITTIYPAAITLSQTSGTPGSSFTVSGSHFQASENVVIDFDATKVATATTDAQGSFSDVTANVPADASIGDHTVTARAQGSTAGAHADFTVYPGSLAVTTTSLPAAIVGTSYSAKVAVSGGEPPYHWSISEGALPDGLVLDQSTGMIAGTPTARAVTDFAVTVSDSGGGEVTAQLSIATSGPLVRTTALATGMLFGCALIDDGSVECWGWNDWGTLGDGTANDSSIPVPVVGLSAPAVAVSASYRNACALLNTGEVECWGDNSWGQLGDGLPITPYTQSATPVQVVGISDAVAISVGPFDSCAVLSTGAVKCWGDNSEGELGDGTTTSSSTPVDVSGLQSGVTAVSAGTIYSTCALLTSGGVKCWGNNGGGTLGDGGGETISRTPVDVTGLQTGVTAITSGLDGYECALLAGGSVECWGSSVHGAFGATQWSGTPIPVPGLESSVSAVSAGYEHTCAIVVGDVACLGWNAKGQLGNGTTTDSSTPVTVTGLNSGATAISSGYMLTCALFASGAVDCWGALQDTGTGNGNGGSLGDGTTTGSSTPVAVLGFGS